MCFIFNSLIKSIFFVSFSIFEPYRKSIENSYDDWFRKRFENDPLKRDLYLTFMSLFVVHWIVGAIFTMADYCALKWPSIRRYKIQPKELEKSFNLERFMNLATMATVNLFFCFMITTFIHFIPSLHRSATNVPTFTRFIFEFIISIIVVEAGFYYVHRGLHYPSFYKHVHKFHHEWQAPISLTILYVHPIEHFLVNVIPILAGPWILGSHPSFTWFWIVFSLVVGMSNHSGWYYIVNLLGPPLFHDFHHHLFIGNYGLMGLFDRIHRTDLYFRQSRYFQNYRIILGMVPKEIDDKKGD